MKVLCDVHMPYRLVNQPRERGVDATHVNRILDGSETKDSDVAAFADANGMVLISKDRDFRDSHFLNGTPARLLRVTLGNLSNTALLALFEEHWDALVRALAESPRYVELDSGVSSFTRQLAERIACSHTPRPTPDECVGVSNGTGYPA